MKKRRELDALVTNGKLPRRKSKSGHELLRSNDDSDSSEVEEFSVPIGNKAGKKWIGLCPCSSCVALLVFIVMTSCLIACGGLIWMHFELKRDLDNLRERLLTVENRDQGAPEEFQKYHTQMQDLNRTVHNLMTGDKGMDKIAKNLTDMAKELNGLNTLTAELKKGIHDAPYLKQLPSRLDALTSTVAKMGSDIQLAQGKVNSLDDFKKSASEDLAALQKKVTEMENKTQVASIPSVGRENGNHPPSESTINDQVTSKLQMLTVDIDSLNKSLIAKIGALNSSLLMHETRLTLLENFTSQQSSTSFGNTDEKETAIKLKKLLEGDGDGDIPTDEDVSALNSVIDKVDNITALMASLGQQYNKLQSDIKSVNKSVTSTGSMQGMEEFALFQAESLSGFEYLNTTVLKLTDNVEQLFRIFTQNRNELNNATAHIAAILRYIGHHNGTQGTSDQSVTSGTSTPKETTTVAAETTPAPAIKMELVKNMDDLELNFSRWDRQGTGQVDPDDLSDFMATPPTSEELKPFDFNNDGKYSMEEFAVALGFKAKPSKEDTDHTLQ